MISFALSPWPLFVLFGGLALLIAGLPTFIALLRQVDDVTTILIFNLIGCVTLVGWPVALVLACTWPRNPRT